MDNIIHKIEKIILENNSQINEKIVGINFLEKLKYLILENLKSLDGSELENFSSELQQNNDQIKKFSFEERPLKISLNYYKNSLSKIKFPCINDNLSLVLKGLKAVSIFDLNDSKKSISLSILKNMGIVLSAKTITSQIIASDSMILDIDIEKNDLNIEN